MDDAFAGLIGIIIAIAIIVFIIIYVVLPIIGILLGIGVFIAAGIAGFGVISGFFIGLKNFFEILIEAHEKLP